MLVREAALSAKTPAQASSATQAGGGVGEWLSRLFKPMMHPAFAVVATLVLVVGIGGLLYIKKGEDQFAPPSVSSATKSTLDQNIVTPPPAAADPMAETAKTEPASTIALATEGEGRADSDEERVADIVSSKQAAKLRERQEVGKDKAGAVRGTTKKAPARIASGSGEDADAANDNGFEVGDGSKSDAFGYRGQKDGKKESNWAAQKEAELVRAYKKEDCRGAASIANDIRERDPKYYSANTAELEAVQKCRPYVSAEKKRRTAVARKAAKAKPKSKKKGGAKSDKAKAAPADSFDETTAVE